MSELQFKQILKSEEPRYTVGIPVVTESYALLQDRKTGELNAQITFRNISEQRIQDLVVEILCKNADGKKTDGIAEFTYSRLGHSRDQEFGQDEPLLLADTSTRSIEVVIKKATFVDGSEAVAREKSTVLPVQQRLEDYFDDSRIARQYVRDTNNSAKFVAAEQSDIWLCTCGAYNSKSEAKCHVCLLGLQAQYAVLDEQTLKKGLVIYEKEQVQIKKKQAEEVCVQERKSEKTKKLIKIFVPVGALMLACAAIWITLIIPLNKYNDAWVLFDDGAYESAATAFNELDDYKDSARIYRYLSEKRLLMAYGLISEYDEEMTFNEINYIRNEGKHYKIELVEAGRGTVGLKTNGTVFASGISVDVEEWEDIIDVSAGFMHMAGCRADGTVVVAGKRHAVQEWSSVVAIQTGADHTVGLKADGTVVAAGNNGNGQCDVQEWSGVTAIIANDYSTIGIQTDGTVVTTGMNRHGELDLSSWDDIVSISMYGYLTVGLKSDGSVIAAGDNTYGQCDVQDWSDIVEIAAGANYSLGLKSDGSVVAAGANDGGQCDVQGWNNIVMITAGRHHSVGLQADGKVVAAGANDYKQCNVLDWEYIVAIDAGEFHTVAIQSDGKVVAVGKSDDGEIAARGTDLW